MNLMKNTDFDQKRIAQGYQNRPFLHRLVIERFQRDTNGQHYELGLDIGCGSGLSTKALKAICTNVIGTDISPEMIRVAREVCKQDKDISYLVSSAENLSLEKARADIATAAGAIQWIDRDRFLSNLHRLMRTDAYLIIYDFAITDTMIGSPSYTDWWHGQYLIKFPKPYRNESVWKSEDVAPYGFSLDNQIDLQMEYSFCLESFTDFMMIQSNVNARIENGDIEEAAARQWFQKTLSPIFGSQTQRLIFRGYSWYLKNTGF